MASAHPDGGALNQRLFRGRAFAIALCAATIWQTESQGWVTGCREDGLPATDGLPSIAESRCSEGSRLFAAGEVRTAGWGGLAVVSKITGLARSTVNRGEDDLDAEPLPKGRVRRAGGGRRSVCENDPGLVPALERLVAPATLGDPMRPLIWVSKSMEKLAATLTEMGHPISADEPAVLDQNFGHVRHAFPIPPIPNGVRAVGVDIPCGDAGFGPAALEPVKQLLLR